jgi:hypothetical protein
MKYTPLICIGAALNIICLGYITCNQVWSSVTSKNQIQARSKGLITIAQHVKSETCWFNQSGTAFKIGDSVNLAGTQNGRIPTSCIIAPKTKQYLQVGYLENDLQVTQIYSPKEIQNQLSIKEDN